MIDWFIRLRYSVLIDFWFIRLIQSSKSISIETRKVRRSTQRKSVGPELGYRVCEVLNFYGKPTCCTWNENGCRVFILWTNIFFLSEEKEEWHEQENSTPIRTTVAIIHPEIGTLYSLSPWRAIRWSRQSILRSPILIVASTPLCRITETNEKRNTVLSAEILFHPRVVGSIARPLWMELMHIKTIPLQ